VAGPGGRSVGRVSVQVSPDTSGFRNDLKSDLAKLSTLKLEIPTVLDPRGFREDLARLQSQVRRSDIELPVSLDKHSRTAAELKSEASSLGLLAKRNPVQIPVELDSKAIANATNSLGSLSAAGTRARGVFSGLATILGPSKVGVFATLGVAAAGSIPSLLTLAGGISQVAGVGALLPAALGAGAVALGTLKLGLSGVGDALKNAADPTKFAAALKKLAPAAQETVKAIVGLKPAFDGLKLSVQQSLFDGIGRSMQSLGKTYIPVLKGSLAGVAGSFNAAAKAASGVLLSPQSVKDSQTGLANVAKAANYLKAAAAPAVQALRDIGVVGSQYLPGAAGAAATLAKRFGEFIANARKTGQLKGFIDAGLRAMTALGQIAGAVARSILGIVSAAQKAGGGSLQALANILGDVAQVVNGPAFQKGLTTFFSGIQKGAASLGGALPAVGKALAAMAPAIATLASGIGKVAGEAITALAGGIAKLAPALTPLIGLLVNAGSLSIPLIEGIVTALGGILKAGGVSKILSAVGTAISAIADAVVSLLPVFTPMVEIFGTLLQGAVAGAAPVLKALASVLGGILLAAVQALAPVMPQLAAALKSVGETIAASLTTAGPALAQLGAALGGVLLAAIQSLVPLLPQFAQQWAAMVPSITALVPAFTALIQAIIPLLPSIVGLVGQVALLGANLATNPALISAVTLAMQALAAGITVVVPAFNAIVNAIAASLSWFNKMASAVSVTFPPITAKISAAMASAIGAIRGLIATITGAFMPTMRSLIALAQSVWARVRSTFSSSIATIRSLVSSGIANVRATFARISAIAGIVTSVFIRVRSAIVAAMASARNTVSSGVASIRTAIGRLAAIPGQVAGYFASMVSRARAAINSLISAVAAIPGRARSAVGGLAGALYSAGVNLIQGMINGVRAMAGAIASAAASVVSGAISAAKGALGIQSPSTVFRQIGQYLGQGFINGIRGTEAQVVAAARSLSNKVANVGAAYFSKRSALDKQFASLNARLKGATKKQRAILAQQIANVKADMKALNKAYKVTGGESAVLAYITKTTAQAKKIASQRAVVATQLKSAQDKLTAALKTRNDFQAAIADSAKQFAGLATIGTGYGPTGIVQQLRERLAALTVYALNLRKLQKLGISKDVYKQILDMGPEQGGIFASTLLAGGKDAVGQVNKLTSQIASQANTLGATASKTLYQAGVDSAQGLVDGLKSKASALAQAAKSLADRIVAEIRRRLKIKSPSRVMFDLFAQAGQGAANGLESKVAAVAKASRGMSAATVKGAGAKLHKGQVYGPSSGINPSGQLPGVVINGGSFGYDPDSIGAAIAKKQRDLVTLTNLRSVGVV